MMQVQMFGNLKYYDTANMKKPQLDANSSYLQQNTHPPFHKFMLPEVKQPFHLEINELLFLRENIF